MATIHCSFCQRSNEVTGIMISGHAAHICNQCIEQAVELIHSNKGNLYNANVTSLMVPTPREIKNHLDQYVIGQEEPKKKLAVAVYNHYKRLSQTDETEEPVIEKSNILLLGETGTGKTYLARTLAKLLNVPFCIADATAITEAGYVGEDVESILSKLLQAADYDVKKTETGIVYIDEIDKIARKDDNPSITRDVSGEGVQQGLLKLLEGTIVNVPPQGGRKHPEQKLIPIDTQNILFICGGAFEGMDKVINRRLNIGAVGFGETKQQDTASKVPAAFSRQVTASDLKSYGMIPELVGRLPVISYLEPIDKVALKKILTEPKNALIKQYKKIFTLEGVTLDVTDDAIDYIVEQALELKLGARGLRAIVEAIMTDLMFDVPSQKEDKPSLLKVDAAYAKEKLQHTYYAS